MGIFDWILKLILFLWLGVFGIGLTDLAIRLQAEAIKTYQRGPVSASKFTEIMTGEIKK